MHQSAKGTCSVQFESNKQCGNYGDSSDDNEEVDYLMTLCKKLLVTLGSCVVLKSFCKNALQLFKLG